MVRPVLPRHRGLYPLKARDYNPHTIVSCQGKIARRKYNGTVMEKAHSSRVALPVFAGFWKIPKMIDELYSCIIEANHL